jgi:hypothetical protein
VEHLLTNVYNGIIWKSMDVPNAIVRCNSLALFVDAFPIMGEQSAISSINEQFSMVAVCVVTKGDIKKEMRIN